MPKFKPFTIVIVILVFAALVESPNVFASDLEWKHIARFHVTSVPSGDVTYLHIRGLPMSSASSGCSQLQVSVNGNEVWLRASLLFLKKGGPFDYIVTVPSNIKRVTFGNLRKEIWPKNEEDPPYSEPEKKALDKAIIAFKSEKPDLSVDDYYAFVDASPQMLTSDHYEVIFYEDGPAPSAVRALYRYWVSKSDDSITYKGRSFAGAMYILEQLGKTDGCPTQLKSNKHPNAKVQALQL